MQIHQRKMTNSVVAVEVADVVFIVFVVVVTIKLVESEMSQKT